jgi:enamine deaminase RidA (YjgF/YER057c/UK114 family)
MNERRNISSLSPWEDTVGYSRAVRIGNVIEVAGTTATDGDAIACRGSCYEQARFIFEKIAGVLQEAGATMGDVVRTRMYITDISKWEEAGRAHAEYFKGIKPASTMVEVTRLIHPDLLIEIEVTAIVGNDKR